MIIDSSRSLLRESVKGVHAMQAWVRETTRNNNFSVEKPKKTDNAGDVVFLPSLDGMLMMMGV
jgi:hypothetical protein